MKQKADPVVSSFRSYKGPLGKYLLIALILVVVIAAVIIALVSKHQDNNNVVTNVCSSGQGELLVGEAALYLHSTDDTSKLSNTVSQIQQLHDYQYDPNCTYAVTAYYIRIFNVSEAKSSLDLFNKYYTNKKINPTLLRYESVEDLRQSVSNMNQELTQAESNSEKLSAKPITGQSKK